LSDADETTKPNNDSDAPEAAQHSPPSENAPPAAPARRGGRVSSGLALILALGALLVAGYLWYVLIYQHPELTRMNLPNALADLEQQQTELQNTLKDTDQRIGSLTETQNTLKTAVDRVQAELGRNQTQWMVSETEQLLLIANRRLQLARDTRSALAALRAADRQLELLASPNLLPVRREIAKEITELESLDRTDVAGMALRLGSIAESVDKLPLALDLRAQPQVAVAETEVKGTGGSARSIWRDLLSLVRIQRQDKPQRPLLAPRQEYFLRQNLQLMLYGAQHALLQGDISIYQQNLATAGRWLDDYFDAESPAVAATQQELEKLRATQVVQQLPDIAASLDMLREAASRREQP
jgi:uroporphyrin-3 C-methyltransferase